MPSPPLPLFYHDRRRAPLPFSPPAIAVILTSSLFSPLKLTTHSPFFLFFSLFLFSPPPLSSSDADLSHLCHWYHHRPTIRIPSIFHPTSPSSPVSFFFAIGFALLPFPPSPLFPSLYCHGHSPCFLYHCRLPLLPFFPPPTSISRCLPSSLSSRSRCQPIITALRRRTPLAPPTSLALSPLPSSPSWPLLSWPSTASLSSLFSAVASTSVAHHRRRLSPLPSVVVLHWYRPPPLAPPPSSKPTVNPLPCVLEYSVG